MYAEQSTISRRDVAPTPVGQLEIAFNQFMDVQIRIDHLTTRAMILADKLFGPAPRDVPKGPSNLVEREPPAIDKLNRAVGNAMEALRRLDEELQRLETL